MRFKNEVCNFLFLVFFISILSNNKVFASTVSSNSFLSKNNPKDNSVLLFIDSPNAFINENLVQIGTNNEIVKPFTDKENKTFVPVGFILNCFGYDGVWNEKDKSLTIDIDGKISIVKAGSSDLIISNKKILMESSPKIVDGKFFMDVNYLCSDILGKKVDLSIKGIVSISNNKFVLTKNNIKTMTDEENFKKMLDKNSIYVDAITFDGLFTLEHDEESLIPAENVDFAIPTLVYNSNLDKGDVVKKDENYIYYISGSDIYIADAKKLPEIKILNTINGKDINILPISLHIDKGILTIIGTNIFTYDHSKLKNNIDFEFASDIMNITRTNVIVYNTEKIKDLKKIKEFSIDGKYLSSNKVKDNIYLITNNFINYYYGKEKDSLILSSYLDSSTASKTKTDLKKMYYFSDLKSRSYLNISSVDIKNVKKEAVVSTYLCSGNYIYIINNDMYMTIYEPDLNMPATTSIYKFSFDDGNIVYNNTLNTSNILKP